MDLKIQHEKQANRFIAIIEGKAATLEYSVILEGKTFDYYSTFVPPELRGRKIAETIVRFALEYAKDHHYRVIPSCPYVKHFIDRHPGYQSLVIEK